VNSLKSGKRIKLNIHAIKIITLEYSKYCCVININTAIIVKEMDIPVRSSLISSQKECLFVYSLSKRNTRAQIENM